MLRLVLTLRSPSSALTDHNLMSGAWQNTSAISRRDICPIHRIPNEILLHILWLGLPPFGEELPMRWDEFHRGSFLVRPYLVRIQLVCKLWRTLCISTPRFWTMVTWTDNDWVRCGEYNAEPATKSLNAFRLFLSRSKTLPIHVYLDSPYFWLTLYEEDNEGHIRSVSCAVSSELSCHAERVQSLYLAESTR